MTSHVKIKIKRSKHYMKRSFHILCPNVAGFLKNGLKQQKKSHLKKEKLTDEPFEVTRTRNCAECGLDEEMRWLALHPSLMNTLYIYCINQLRYLFILNNA